ncbi:MAG: hypothetical protein QOD99_1407, partial [Chthoniobacter sp.]|nr:hypothetical protein [Chthoniobacter sp.]
MIVRPKLRALSVCILFALCFTLFSARLVQLQVCRHDYYLKLAADAHVGKETVPAERGMIQDINGITLAENEPLCSVVADGPLILKIGQDPEELAAELAKPLEMKKADLVAKLTTQRHAVFLKKISPMVVKELMADRERRLALDKRLKLPSLRGVSFEPDPARIYANGSMLSHVIGFTNEKHRGVQGIESSMDDYLTGYDGFRYIEHDRRGKEIVLYRGLERAPRNGSNVRLTVDLGLQNIVETALSEACAEYRPEMAVVILMRPKTGEILALANRPTFDLNDLRNNPAQFSKLSAEALKNHAVIDAIEPGSTFKIVTASAALNERNVSPDTMIFCENGRFNFAGKTLHDHGPGYAELSVEDILMHSSNIGAAKLALGLGDQKFYQYIRSFGFGERSGVALPGEIRGLLRPTNEWHGTDITRIAMGQSVGVTPLQTITAMAAIANGGHLMMPQIVHEISDEDGSVITRFPPMEVRQVIRSETAKQVCNALKKVTSDKGTAKAVVVPGFTVAGKTGT